MKKTHIIGIIIIALAIGIIMTTAGDASTYVSFSEAIELAKTYGGTDGYKYINGVLDKLATKLRAVEVQSQARKKEESP